MLNIQEIKKDHFDIYQSLHNLLRDYEEELSVFLNQVAFNDNIGNTKTKAHCHIISLDGNKRPRINDFAKFIATKITDFAIPRKEVETALNEAINRKSTAPVDTLNIKAKNLFTKLPKSGEGGEVILSVLAESFLKLPQLFTKMVLKTNTEMHIHGCDGIHAGVNKDGHLVLYWGESKLHTDVTEAIRECFSSLAPFLLGTGGSDAEQSRDLQLMRDGIDFNDDILEDSVKLYLDPNNKFFNKLEYRGLCLVGFDSDKYPVMPNLKKQEDLIIEIKEVFEERKKHINKRLLEEKIDSFIIELFLLPFPSVDDFRTAFRKEIGLK